ncbi:MAG: Ig-like domain-containing protein [Bacteroidales bacterium]|nr:Ig-like domain-containing protein [Bacteroidales bacterium]
MRKSRLYRAGAAFMAALMVLTAAPQTGLYATAAEPNDDVVLQEAEAEQNEELQMQSDDTADGQEAAQTTEELSSQEDGNGIVPYADGDPDPTSIVFDNASVSVQRLSTVQLGCTVYPSDAEQSVTYSSSAPAVATVSASGLVEAKTLGTTTITARSTKNSISATCTVTVTKIPVADIKFTLEKLEVQREDTATLSYTLLPETAYADYKADITFKSTDETIAEIIAENKDAREITIKGIKKGTTSVTASVDGYSASCPVEVTPIPVEKITMTPEPPSKLELDLNAEATTSGTVTVKVEPANADNKGVILVDNYDKSVIEVTFKDDATNATKQVKVKGLKGGSTMLSFRSAENARIFGYCDVTVESKKVDLTGISASPSCPKNLYEGNSLELSKYIVYNPGNAEEENKELTWAVASGGEKYVEVDSKSGRATAKWENETDTNDTKEVTITATAAKATGTNKTATFTLKITRRNVPLQEIYVSPEELVLEDTGNKSSQTVRVQLNPLTSTERNILAKVTPASSSKRTDGKSAVTVEAVNPYKYKNSNDDEVIISDVGQADTNGYVSFKVTANELEGLEKTDTCKITFYAAKITFSDGTPKVNEGKIKEECDVTVNKYVTPVGKLELDRSLTLKDGEEKELTAVIGPLTAEDRHIVWTVDDPEIAEIIGGVDTDGRNEAALVDGELAATVKIRANMVGTCKITATAAGDVKKTCEVTVTNGAQFATGLTITSDGVRDENGDKTETTEITLKPGQTYRLDPTVEPADAANKKVKWTSSSPAVASVAKQDGQGEAGFVTANALGVCTITAHASGESSACTKTVLVHVINPHMEVHYKGEPDAWAYVPEDQPITEEMLRDRINVFFWPIVKPVPEEDRVTIESGWAAPADGDADYTLRILREDGKTEKVFESKDMETPGVKTLVISYTYNGVTYKASIQVEMKEFDEADLISVTPLSGEDADIWNVPNGTPASSLPLPETTEIVVGRTVKVSTDEGEKDELKTSRLDAEIEWDVAASGYDSSSAEAQEFTVFGTVQLPEYVHNPNNVSLLVQVQMHVREQNVSGKRAARPRFSVLDGKEIANKTAVELPYGSKIILTTDTEEAQIYYMVDRMPDAERGIPHDEEHQYKSPITITAKTTTIYAIAAKSGYDDSECSECTIKLYQADPADPDDPDGPLPDDVTDEDKEEIGGKVPDGLWAVVQKGEDEKDGFPYTGKAIKPAVHVYDRTMLLTEKTDYTLAYSNNINVGSAKLPTITVTGKGNYEGKAVLNFTILPQDITDDSVVMDEYMAVAYNKKAQKPNPSLSWNGKKLTKNKDYTYDNTSYTDPGTYKVTVTGMGNYKGTRTMDYEIYQGGVAVSKLNISKIADQKYTGMPIQPPVTVKYKNTTLALGTKNGKTGNYYLKYENCTEVGTASVVIYGKGNYKGSKRINFKILPTAKINQAAITLDLPAGGVSYTGEPYRPACIVKYGGKDLKEEQDYTVSYQNNINVGTATVVITGKGAYAGTAKKTFKILKNDISGLAAVMDSSFTYEKGGCKPKPTITYNGMTLKEGTDYTLTYKNHNKIGNTAYVTVKGKGNYKGQIVRYFAVTVQDISNLTVVAADKVYQQKKNIYKTSVKVIDLNGKALTAGTDYDKAVYYTYESGDKAGQRVLSTDIIPVGTVIGVDIRVSNPRCYQGTVHGTYRIVRASVANAKVTIPAQEYTGRSIRPKKSQIQVVVNKVPLGDNDYEIVSYENNIKQGTAKITIRGVGGYGGTKTATFKIRKKGILNLKF